MQRITINRSGEMEVFVRVIEQGGFSHAARSLGMTPSAVSKLVTRLESRLGTRLLNRSTRRLELTPEGCAFFESSATILANIEEAENQAGRGEQPAGPIRLNTSASYATHILSPLLPEFFMEYPAITLDLVQTDNVIDLVADRTDVAVRAGPLKSSSLVARKLGASPMVIVAAPGYLERFGVPEAIADLEAHVRIGFGYARHVSGWPLHDGTRIVECPSGSTIRASDGEAVRHLARDGVGLARLAAFSVEKDIATRRLVPVLNQFNPGDREDFHAVYVGQGGPTPARVRVLLDFLASKGRIA